MTALAALPPVRNPTNRDGRSTRLRNTRRGQIASFEANLAQITGQVNVPECDHCTRGCGVWTLCISVPGQLRGSCANCHNIKGARCSLPWRASASSFAAIIAAAANPNSPAGPAAPAPAPAAAPYTSRLRCRITPTLDSGPRNIEPAAAVPAAPTVSGTRGGCESHGGRGERVARSGGLIGSVRVPRRSRAEWMRAIAAAHQQLADLYSEEAGRLEGGW